MDISSSSIVGIKKIIAASVALQHWKKSIDISFNIQPMLRSFEYLHPVFEKLKASEIEHAFIEWINMVMIEITDYRIWGILGRDNISGRVIFLSKDLEDVNDWLNSD